MTWKTFVTSVATITALALPSAASALKPNATSGLQNGTSRYAQSPCGTQYWFGRQADGKAFGHAHVNNTNCRVTFDVYATGCSGNLCVAWHGGIAQLVSTYTSYSPWLFLSRDFKIVVKTWPPYGLAPSTETHTL